LFAFQIRDNTGKRGSGQLLIDASGQELNWFVCWRDSTFCLKPVT
jgi:hypothetical protein